jgi:hypothetical protein
MKILISIITAILFVSCASTSDKTSKSEIGKSADASDVNDRKIYLETRDIVLEDGTATLPLSVKCVEGFESVVVQFGDNYKAFKCDKGRVNYNHKFPISELKQSRDKKKDHVVRIRAFHADKKDTTLAQLLVIVSYKDYQTKLVINQNLLTIDRMEGTFSDLGAHGQCVEGSNIEIEVYDDWRGISLEEQNLPCSEAGFAFFTRKPGVVKKGMRLLIRQKRGDKAVASYEVVLFN